MSFLPALLCPLFVLVFFVVLIVAIIRRIRQGTARTNWIRNYTPRLAADGFWLDSFEPSSNVYFRYWTAGVMHSGQVTFQVSPGGRQFVYTGMQPDRVEIVRVVALGDAYAPSTGVFVDYVATQAPDSPLPPSPSSFPSAY
jgi:hypothetical protein